MARRKSRAEAEIEARLKTLDPSSERFRILVAARDFKAAWVAFGEFLTKVRESSRYKSWGYDTFEIYCRQELRLRQDTANKLTRSFAYLRDHEPAVVRNREREMPPLDVVDLMSRAAERTKVTPSQLGEIHEEVFAPEVDYPSRNQVVKRFREIDPEAFKGTPRGPADASKGRQAQELRKALLLAERLQALLEEQGGVSDKALTGVRQAAIELRQLFEASQEKKSA